MSGDVVRDLLVDDTRNANHLGRFAEELIAVVQIISSLLVVAGRGLGRLPREENVGVAVQQLRALAFRGDRSGWWRRCRVRGRRDWI